MPDALPGWRDAAGAAAHLSLSLDGFRRLVRTGRLPAGHAPPGVRKARWHTSDLDAAWRGLPVDTQQAAAVASMDANAAVEALVQKIRRSAANRPARAGRRQGQGIPVSSSPR